MKKLLALVLAALTLLTGAAFAEIDPTIPTDTTTEITFWHSFNGDNEAVLTKQIEAFQTEYPYIKVNAQYIGGYNDIHTELASANAAGRRSGAVRHQCSASDQLRCRPRGRGSE